MSYAQVPVRTRWLGAALVLAGVLFQALWLGLPAIFLSVALLIAFALWVGSRWRFVPRLRVAFSLAIAAFVGHATEEYLAGFHHDLPALFGSVPWTDRQFLVFNAIWGVVFVACALAVGPGRTLPVLFILFFAIAGGVGNGVLHLLLVAQRGAYFPGAGTAPLLLAVGIWLLWLLYASPGHAEEHTLRHTTPTPPPTAAS